MSAWRRPSRSPCGRLRSAQGPAGLTIYKLCSLRIRSSGSCACRTTSSARDRGKTPEGVLPGTGMRNAVIGDCAVSAEARPPAGRKIRPRRATENGDCAILVSLADLRGLQGERGDGSGLVPDRRLRIASVSGAGRAGVSNPVAALRFFRIEWALGGSSEQWPIKGSGVSTGGPGQSASV